MNFSRLIAAVLMLAATSALSAIEFIPANHKGIAYTGRVNHSDPKSPLMVFPGTQIRANFTGSSISMKAKPGSGYFMVNVDNAPARKIFFGTQDSIINIAHDLKGSRHTVNVMLAFEGHKARPEFRGFILDDGCSLAGEPSMPVRKLEFIGNSITCGYGVEAQNEKVHFSDSTENHYYTYAAISSRSLNAQHMVVARSGIGMYRNYNGPREGSEDNMPRWYEYTSIYDNSQKWDHSKYNADVICINLGTNDFSTKGYDTSRYCANYEAFVKHLRKLHPKAKIVMLTGPMLMGDTNKMHISLLDDVYKKLCNGGIKDIYRFNFTPQTGSLGYGADYHPSKAQQQKMANELIPFIRKITGWK